jgi:thiol-disulfide isomerase/thioredoxin
MTKHEEQLDRLLPLAGGHHKHFSILLLTQEHCGFCEQAQDILQRLSQEYWLSVSTLDMASPEGQRLAMQGGLLFPPGILIDGEPFSYGRLSEHKLRRELDRRSGFVDRPRMSLSSNMSTHESRGMTPGAM